MAKWSVALFGYDKPRFYVQEVATGKTVFAVNDDPGDVGPDLMVYVVTGNSPRNVVGDVVAFKPIADAGKWTPTERKHYLIIAIDGLTRSQMEALREPVWDAITDPEGTFITKKSRFGFPIADLQAIGVDIIRMKDKGEEYQPTIMPNTNKTAVFDKLNSRYVRNGDKLRKFNPDD